MSPLGLLQETLRSDDGHLAWRVIVTCALLNRTDGRRQVRPFWANCSPAATGRC